LLDRAGLALGALLVFLVATRCPASPRPPNCCRSRGHPRQSLPIGAGATLLRSVAYFDGNGSARAVTVLVAYAIGVLSWFGRRRA